MVITLLGGLSVLARPRDYVNALLPVSAGMPGMRLSVCGAWQCCASSIHHFADQALPVCGSVVFGWGIGWHGPKVGGDQGAPGGELA